MYLSYSGFDRGESCQLSWWHVYLNKTVHGKPDDRLGSIYGSAVGTLFEKFYNDKLWQKPNTRKVLEDMAPGVVDGHLHDAVNPGKIHHAGVLLWRGEGEGQNPNGLYFDRDELVRDVAATVSRGLRTIKENLLLDRDAVAELKLDSRVKGHYLAGRTDFHMKRVQHRDLVILDGKGTTHTFIEDGVRHAKYHKDDQLIWYSLLYQERFQRLPDKVGFVFWKYEPPTNLTWVELSQEIVDQLRDRALSLADQLQEKRTRLYGNSLTENQLAKGMAAPPRPLAEARGLFPPTPNKQNCQFCPYATEEFCPEGFKIVEELSRKKRKV